MKVEVKAQKSAKWSLLGKGLSQLLSWAITFFLFSILAPEDYGFLALAVILVAYFVEINDFGMSAALVQRKYLPHNLMRAAFGFILIMSAASSIIILFAAPFVADYYNMPELIPLIRFTSLQILVGAFMVLPKAQVIRELNGKKREIIFICRNIILSIVTLILALSGFGVWSFLIGNLMGTLTATVLFNIYAPVHYLPLLSYRKVRLLLNFGFNSIAQNIIGMLSRTVDVLLFGKYVGSITLGFYSAAKNLASLPSEKFGMVIKEISLSGLSRFNEDPSAFSYLLIRGIRLMSFILFPVYIGIASVAPDLISFAWGDKWVELILPLQILSLVMPLQMFLVPFGEALNASNNPSVFTVNGFIVLIIMSICFYFGASHGIVGISLAWVIGLPIAFSISIFRAGKYLGVTLWQVIKEFMGPFTSALLMAAGIYFFRHFMNGSLGFGLMTLLDILLGVFIYTISSYFLCRKIFYEFISFVKK